MKRQVKKLKENWVTDYPLDFEYNQYVLLAYLHEAQKSFRKVELQPVIEDLAEQKDKLRQLKVDTYRMQKSFPAKPSALDFKSGKIIYKSTVKKEEYILHIEKTLEFALPKIKETYKEGKEVYKFAASQCFLEPIGMLPLNVKEGYLFISPETNTEASLYYYNLGLYETGASNVPSLHVRYMENIRKARVETWEYVKRRLIKRFRHMPNPATYLFHANIKFPLESTILPLARESLLRFITVS